MNCISKYLVANEEERRVMYLARTVRHKQPWRLEDYEFFHQRYAPTRRYIIERGKNDFSWDIGREKMARALRESERECVKEAQEIKRREVDPKNVAYNLGVLALQSLVGGFINLIGGMGGGIHYIPNEEAYRSNYKTSPEV